ncbi:low molecular weight phosphotyrosine protein phosphatase [Hyphobacterium sp. CCMP332]|nr:low molecular weight phosphotyrosine protein phosphatase [Hyphobacterium sp. CCMP332]
MKIKVLFVCLGNICRSPMAEGLMISKIKARGIDHIDVESAGTSNYHIGEMPDNRMLETAAQNGIILESRARQFSMLDFEKFDYIIAMDKSNKADILKLARNDEERKKVRLMRDFDDKSDENDVPDPYFGGHKGFEYVFDILERSSENLLNSILENRT